MGLLMVLNGGFVRCEKKGVVNVDVLEVLVGGWVGVVGKVCVGVWGMDVELIGGVLVLIGGDLGVEGG